MDGNVYRVKLKEATRRGVPKVKRRSKGEIVFKAYPLWIWLPGVVTVAVVAILPLAFSERALIQLLGFVLLACPSILTVTVDRRHETLNLHYRSLFRGSTQVYRFDEIAFINVAEDREGERMYRVELILRSGRVVPLQCGYSVGKARKEGRAQRLRDALGIGSEVSGTRATLQLRRGKG